MQPLSTTSRIELTPEDQALDDLWRTCFNQPLPIIGAGDVVREILKNNGMSESDIRRAISVRASSPQPSLV